MRSPNLRANVDGPRRVPPTVVATVGGTIVPSLGHLGLILGWSGADLGALKPKWLASGALGALWGCLGGRLGPFLGTY